MLAAYVEALGGADRIRVGRLPDPPPAPDEVLVRVEASAVNAVDTFVRSGAYRTPTPFPFVVGRDLVGVVEALGANVTTFSVGDRVWCNSMGHGGRQGAAAELACVPEARLYHLPAGCDAVPTVALLHPAATAHLALWTHGRAKPGETLVVVGGAGHVGSMLVSMAAWAGLRVVTTASPGDHDRCRALGAEVVLDRSSDELDRLLADALPRGADLWVDTAGVNDLALAVPLLAQRGRIVALAGMASHPRVPWGALYTRDASIVGFAISNATVDELAEAAVHVNDLLSTRRLPALEVEAWPLAEAARAHAELEAGRLGRRRVVLVP